MKLLLAHNQEEIFCEEKRSWGKDLFFEEGKKFS